MSGESGFKLPLFVHSSIDDASLSPGAFRVLCHLARRAGNKGVAFPGIRNIAKTCRMNCGTVIDAIRELEQFRFVLANRKPGRPTAYRLFPELKPGSEVVPKTTRAEAASVAYLGNSDQSRGVTHLGNGVLPTQVTGCSLTNHADQVPERMEPPEGTPIRYSNKVLRSSANALTQSLSYEKEKEVTEKEEDPGYQLLTKAEPPENSSFSVTRSETKHWPLRERAKLRRDPRSSGQRPESEAEVIAYVLSRGHKEEDGRYMWANWRSNGFTNAGRPIRDWKAVIDSRACQGFLPSQKKLAERRAKNGIRGNLI
jgi:hypothetical protein